jgi:hypothetical protein
MTQTATNLKDRQAAENAALNLAHELEAKFLSLTGVCPSIISPDRNPFASFRPKNRAEYLAILEVLQPAENFTLTFAGKADIPTFSPYSIHYGGKHSSPNYMDATVKFSNEICPIWIKLPDEVKADKFSVHRMQGEHKGFGNYEALYTLSANEGRTTVQRYYGENKTMYAANEAEADKLKAFIFS